MFLRDPPLKIWGFDVESCVVFQMEVRTGEAEGYILKLPYFTLVVIKRVASKY